MKRSRSTFVLLVAFAGVACSPDSPGAGEAADTSIGDAATFETTGGDAADAHADETPDARPETYELTCCSCTHLPTDVDCGPNPRDAHLDSSEATDAADAADAGD